MRSGGGRSSSFDAEARDAVLTARGVALPPLRHGAALFATGTGAAAEDEAGRSGGGGGRGGRAAWKTGGGRGGGGRGKGGGNGPRRIINVIRMIRLMGSTKIKSSVCPWE